MRHLGRGSRLASVLKEVIQYYEKFPRYMIIWNIYWHGKKHIDCFSRVENSLGNIYPILKGDSNKNL